ncbi:hypothetical protein EDC96DRAFT_595300 [Choanephora cucurbitarum]|nr:hypothetical protein EDC96DRAFT_595300 [Choanephora cucurbitarum]
MITNNLNTSDSLINRTTGTLKKIKFGYYRPSQQSEPIQKAIRVWLLNVDTDSGKNKRAAIKDIVRNNPSISATWAPIDPVSLIVRDKTQFPLTIFEAVTIHKSQESTYRKAAVDLTGRSLKRLLMYVAYSRATSASDFYLIGNKFKPTMPPAPNSSIAFELERKGTVQLKPRSRILLKKTLHFEFSGFEEITRVDNLSTTPRANGNLCFVKKHLIKDRRVSSKYATMIQDQNNHKMSISSFMVDEH